ncbi:MAG: efflux RND transporter permease subunit [Armatimonadetes bacterium]|nr:efflux RND transporter permease subunit [Armatimonadota bacterium]
MKSRFGMAGRTAAAFIDSKLTLLIIITSVLGGVFATIMLPREEEPQIIVPMIDVMVQAPGMSAKEVEQRVTEPMERLLWEIPGVEYVYSTSMPSMAMVIVRYKVGSNETDSVVKTYNKMYANFDLIPAGVSQPLVKPRWIDDVPVLTLTLWGERYNSAQLREMAASVIQEIKQVPDVSETRIIGGQRRQLRASLDPVRLASYHLSPGAVAQMVEGANQQLTVGSVASGGEEVQIEAGPWLTSAENLGRVVVGVFGGRPVYLADVADISDGPEDPVTYVGFVAGPSAHEKGIEVSHPGRTYPAVTISVAKRKGTNAATVAHHVLAKLEGMRGQDFPRDLQMTVTRNYGETATDKSNELLKHMFIAIIAVTLLVAVTLGVRESGVVLLAIPTTLALTLVVFLLYGYTLNRITLFALIFTIGILVDDAIVVVENIVRHFRLPESRGRSLMQVAIEAVDEVGNPTILATFAVIAAILPLAFVRGLMGPYMRPIPIGASAAMIFSLVIAFVVSPWAALRLLGAGEGGHHEAVAEGWATRLYRRAMNRLVTDRHLAHVFLGVIGVALVVAVALLPAKLVVFKMLPFDNKSEFQVVIDTPEGTTLEDTAAVARALAEKVCQVPEVTDVETYAGTASPYNFNGLIRHYFMRRGPNVADLQVNLIPRHERKRPSHEIARSIRPELTEIARRMGADIKVAEVPPGPPVISTLVAEIYGPDYRRQQEIGREIERIFRETPGVVDVDTYIEAEQPKLRFVADREKAALVGVDINQVTKTLAVAVYGAQMGLAHLPQAPEDVPVVIDVPRPRRADPAALEGIHVQAPDGRLIPLSELVRVERTTADTNIYHKNLMPVVYVLAEAGGRFESPAYPIMEMSKAIAKLKIPEGYKIAQYSTHLPPNSDRFAMKWDGEWHITYEVFRDMGLAFAAVLVLIYILVVGWFQNYRTPLIIMTVIPISLIGILPAHWMLGAFFTATSMIGFIAGAGIVVRNSIILVDFIDLRANQGMPLDQAAIDAGVVRFRPIMLTAMAVFVSASVILFDPIFQGMAISLMAGELVLLILSPVVVPLLYFMAGGNNVVASDDGEAPVDGAPTDEPASDEPATTDRPDDGQEAPEETADDDSDGPDTDDGGTS